MQSKIYVGTELKFTISIRASGFDMSEDNWEVDIVCNSNTVHIDKSDAIEDGQGLWYICFDTQELGVGAYYAIIKAYVPDSDFEDGFRTEIKKEFLLNVASL